MIRADKIQNMNETITNFQLLNITFSDLDRIINTLYNKPRMITTGKIKAKKINKAKGDISNLRYHGNLINLSIKL